MALPLYCTALAAADTASEAAALSVSAAAAGAVYQPPLHGKPVLGPYPPLQPLQQRRLAARRHSVT